MKSWRIEDGVLICQPRDYSRPDARYPHRHSVIAHCEAEGVEFEVITNHRRNRYWLNATGSGLAGARSKRINTVGTGSPVIMQQWCDALDAGKVRIE